MCINEEYLPAILGALEVLTIPEYWDVPEDIIPQIMALQDVLAGTPDDCGSVSPTYCAKYDFASDDHSGIFSGLAVFGLGTPAWVSGIGWSLSTVCASGGGSGSAAFMVLKAVFPSPVTVDYIRISYGTTAESDANGSYGILVDHVSAGGNDGAWATLTGFHGNGFDGTDTTGIHSKTDTEHFIEIQIQPAGGSSCPAGVMFIREIQFYGSGDAPPDSAPCV